MRTRAGLAGLLGSAALIVGALAAPATAAPLAGVPTPVVTGLQGPLHVTFGLDGRLLVADTFTGVIYSADPATGAKTVLATGVQAPTSISQAPNGTLYVTRSSATPTQGPTSLARLAPDGSLTQVADLLAYEQRNNPDGQPQQTGPDADTLSNPYDVLALPGRILVADAGANDILSVGSGGKVRTLTAFPRLFNGECAKRTDNGIPNGGCDPVPTAMALGPDGFLYVSGLGGEVRGRVYKIDLSTGAVVSRILELPPLTGIAVDADGTIYVSSVFRNRIIKIATDGTRTAVTVPAVTDVTIGNGAIYAGSLTGTVFRVPFDSFGPF